MYLGLNDGRRNQGDGMGSGWESMARFEVGGLEAAVKIAICLRLCLEPHLKQENIFYAPPLQYGNRIIVPCGNHIRGSTK